MQRILTFLAFTAIFLPLLSVASAPYDSERLDQIMQVSEDPKCSKGFHPGFESNVWQFNVPATAFIKKSGSFFHSEWYTGALNATQGKDDTVGSTRTMYFENEKFVERLVGVFRSPTQYIQRYSRVVPEKPGPVGGVTLTSYTEEIRATSICGGTATHYSIITTYCTDKVEATYDLVDKFHSGTVQNLASELGALTFAGTCPAGYKA